MNCTKIVCKKLEKNQRPMQVNLRMVQVTRDESMFPGTCLLINSHSYAVEGSKTFYH